jgi:predicted nucleic acid-binding protein
VLKPGAFWDASTLVPLCIRQPLSPRSFKLFETYQVTVWWATPVEMTSALARLLRRQEIAQPIYTQAMREMDGIANLWDVIAPLEKVARDARALLELYPLRAADALQLAAALTWCEGNPKGNVFLTFDHRLREAAQSAGFTLE